MQQLSGLDASFLYLETANAPMHISSLAIYDQSTAPGGKVRFKDIIENTTNRIRRLPILSYRAAGARGLAPALHSGRAGTRQTPGPQPSAMGNVRD